jgi:cytochrome c-type biogenesis protein CcmE
MRTWTVRSKGRLERIIIFYFILSILAIGFFLYAARRNMREFLPMDAAEMFSHY